MAASTTTSSAAMTGTQMRDRRRPKVCVYQVGGRAARPMAPPLTVGLAPADSADGADDAVAVEPVVLRRAVAERGVLVAARGLRVVVEPRLRAGRVGRRPAQDLLDLVRVELQPAVAAVLLPELGHDQRRDADRVW